MGGMFTVFKVRKDQKPGDYKDPGAYKFPETVAYEWNGTTPQFATRPSGSAEATPAARRCQPPSIHPVARNLRGRAG
jgi:hypothetical protein